MDAQAAHIVYFVVDMKMFLLGKNPNGMSGSVSGVVVVSNFLFSYFYS